MDGNLQSAIIQATWEGHLELWVQITFILEKEFWQMTDFVWKRFQRGGGKLYTPSINIGDDVAFGQGCHITCACSINIGHDTNIMPYVLITDLEHCYELGKNIGYTGINVGSVTIGNYVSVGMGARILGKSNIAIGENAVIGTNAIITKNVPDRAIVVGNGKIIGYVE